MGYQSNLFRMALGHNQHVPSKGRFELLGTSTLPLEIATIEAEIITQLI